MEQEESSRRLKHVTGFLTLASIRDIVVMILLAVIAWKLFSSDISVSIDKFGFSEFLSIILAFFAISLAVAFYFKATETSNRFYDNVYKFTKDTSEILGRIEAGFGEKLRHIDQSYSGLKQSFDQMPFDLPKARADVEREIEEMKQKEAEKLKLLEELAQKAQLAEGEKEQLFEEIEKRDAELVEQRDELRTLNRKIRRAESSKGDSTGLEGYLRNKLPMISNTSLLEESPDFIRELFQREKGRLALIALTDMQKLGFLNTRKRLSSSGVDLIYRLIAENNSEFDL